MPCHCHSLLDILSIGYFCLPMYSTRLGAIFFSFIPANVSCYGNHHSHIPLSLLYCESWLKDRGMSFNFASYLVASKTSEQWPLHIFQSNCIHLKKFCENSYWAGRVFICMHILWIYFMYFITLITMKMHF